MTHTIRPARAIQSGEVQRLSHTSVVLADNPWGDPVTRELLVYLPPGFQQESDRRYPCLWALAGYTGSGLAMDNWRGFGESLPQRLDRLIASDEMGPVIVVMPDAFTSLGGNQYVDSSTLGAYSTWLTQELVPFVDENFPTLASARHRGVFGKSSGGYGALYQVMNTDDLWGAAASHAGDAHFDVVYRRDFATTANVLSQYEFDFKRFLDRFWRRPKPPNGDEVHALMILCMAASYDPDPGPDPGPDSGPGQSMGFKLPFDPFTLELDEKRWARWLEFDPIHMALQQTERLKNLRALYLDCGYRDQYAIHYGNRILAKRLEENGISHHYEEFNGTHSGIDYRLDVSLPFLYRALSEDE